MKIFKLVERIIINRDFEWGCRCLNDKEPSYKCDICLYSFLKSNYCDKFMAIYNENIKTE